MFTKKQKIAPDRPLIGLAQVGGELVICWVEYEAGEPILQDCLRAPCAQIIDGISILSQWVKEHKLSGAQVNFVLEPGTYNLYLLEEPEASQEEMNNAVKWRVKDYLEYDVEQAVIDYIALPQKKNVDVTKMGYAIAANQKFIDDTMNLIESADLKLNSIEIAETALRNIGVRISEQEQGIAWLYLAAKESQLVLLKKNQIHLMRKVDINMKHVFEPENVDKEMIDVYNERFVNDLVLEVQRSIDYCSSALRQTPTKHIAIGPMPIQIDEMIAPIQDGLGMPVLLKDFKSVVKCKKTINEIDQNKCLYALGGALRESTS